ncbi:MAG: hypothetical protein EZS28_027569 [Streblomastix strix]|uniref:Uncharacterized protein n=1 Tax=Streblomastix strix TaxID=222440 RepID=A0A5J4V319_9EUKA|nr:MAG: hypothetical protein EZS28_027569 [Streblomastix strix]
MNIKSHDIVVQQQIILDDIQARRESRITDQAPPPVLLKPIVRTKNAQQPPVLLKPTVRTKKVQQATVLLKPIVRTKNAQQPPVLLKPIVRTKNAQQPPVLLKPVIAPVPGEDLTIDDSSEEDFAVIDKRIFQWIYKMKPRKMIQRNYLINKELQMVHIELLQVHVVVALKFLGPKPAHKEVSHRNMVSGNNDDACSAVIAV